MKKILIIFYLQLLTSCIYGQSDSTKSEINSYTTFRAGLGFEKTTYLELGLSRITISDKGLNSGSLCFYTSAQLGIINGHINYGIKAGFETAWMIGMWAIEAKYITDNKNSKFYFTPKAGLSLLGAVNILYGYNVGIGNHNFVDIGKHQVSVTANLSKKLIRDSK